MTLSRGTRILAPIVLAGLVLGIWQAAVDIAGVPRMLLPSPTDIGVAVVSHGYELRNDWLQTVWKSAIPGYLIGNAAGLFVALIIDRSRFIQRGLMPIATLFSALPIIGIAPIAVMWFGFDWQSKAFVVALMCFFPMLANAGTSLRSSDYLLRDLMQSYSASYGQTLWWLRMPKMLPHVLTALKLNAPASVIGAMIAEFFGNPTFGLGFRMSSEVGRLGFDVVWAAILVATLSGSAIYGIVALAERKFTFWHSSARQ